MKYSVITDITAEAWMPNLGMNKIFRTTFSTSAYKVMNMTILKKPMPFSVVPVRLFIPAAMIAGASILSMLADAAKRSV